ncbi:MFS transporter [Bifidobacterium callitrichos]|uniref:MFS transporter n=2 Tax=Bifidobacterium callitrichos TaxID=762209 RepID=A0A5M9ZB05_9BIFI|nr:MFS transporter [Bifidobacterium callitrichos]
MAMASFEELTNDMDLAALASRRSRYTTLMVALGVFGGGLYGYTLTALSGALITMNIGTGENGLLTSGEQGLITSLLLLGAIVGSFLGGTLFDRLGPRRMIRIGALLAVPGAVICAVCPNLIVLYVGRLIMGLAIGFTSTIIPLYLGEMTSAAKRGRIVSVNSVMIVVFQLLAVSVNAVMNVMGADWRAMLWAVVVPAAALLIVAVIISDSPYHMARHGLDAEAVRLLVETRDEMEARSTYEAMTAGPKSGEDSKSRHPGFSEPWLRRVLIVGIGVALMNQLGGQNMINYYAPTIFSSTLGFDSSMAIVATVPVIAVSAVAAVIGGLGLIDRIDRRVILLTGLAGTVIFLVAIGVSYIFVNANPGSGTAAWVMIALMMIYLVFVQGMVAPVSWLLLAEVFPSFARGRGVGYANIAMNVANFLLSLVFPVLLGLVGGSGTFFVFAVINIACFIFAKVMVPETRGKSLEQIELEARERGGAKA